MVSNNQDLRTMTTPTRKLLLLSLLISLGHAAAAAPMRYHGQLSDGGQPANGRYDLQISLYNSADAGGLLGYPTTLENVEVVNGQFQVELEAPAAAQNSAAWLQAAVRDGASNGVFNEIAGREKVTLAPLIGACWSTTGDSGSNPAVNFLGNTDNQTLVLSSPFGVRINQPGQLTGFADLVVHARPVSGDADADLHLSSRTGKLAKIYVRDGNGNLVLSSDAASSGLEFFSNYLPAVQNDGRPVATFTGRLRLKAAGTGAGDVSGGVWLDDETTQRSYLGRGSNSQNWTGVFADNAWRMAVHDDGLVTINTTVDTLGGADLTLAARPVGGDADVDLVMVTRAGKKGSLYLKESTGGFALTAHDLSAGENFLRASNGAALSNGGVWINASSRELKEGFAAIDPGAILAKVLTLPITTWSYKTSAEGTHIGPVAEDFKETFGFAGDGKSIPTVDADGVALAAIQGLNAKLEAENADLRARLERIEQRLQVGQ
jgi:hypothetical protein